MEKHVYSLVIPCHNEEKTINRVIEKSETLVDEMIIVNDCSKDKTQEILRNQDNIILIENKKRIGQEKSIEKGIKKVRGDIIITMDADMEHDPLDIHHFKNYFIKNKFDLIIGKRSVIPRKGEKKLNKLFEEKYKITDVMNGFRLFKKKLYDEIGFYYKNNYYGLDFLMEALKKYEVGQIEISDRKRRNDPRIGSDERINDELEEIISYVKKSFRNEK